MTAKHRHHRLRAACLHGRLRSGLLLLCLIAGPAAAQTVQLAARTDLGVGTFTYEMTNLDAASDTITTTGPGVLTASALIASVADPALPVTLTQAGNPRYGLTSASCVDSSTGTGGIGLLVGNTLTIAPAALLPGATLLCTFDNAQVDPDLAIVKTADLSTVASGGTLVYTLTASNVGLVDVDNAVLSDTPGAGLSCTSAGSCTSSGGAVCPGTLPAGSLYGGGVTIPSLPVGGRVIVTAACTVTASGQ